MRRVQIQLTEEQHERLRRESARRGRSMAAVARDAIDAHLDEPGDDAVRRAALDVIGGFSSGRGGSVSEDHDDALAEAFEDPTA